MNDVIVIDESIELLYGSSTEKVAAARLIASLCVDIRVLEHVVEQHQLMSAFARLLEDDLNVELSFVIGKVLLAISMVEDFHEILSNHRIGATILSVIETKLSGTREFTTRQEHFLFVCLSILANLATNIKTLRKMVKKGLVPLVLNCLQTMKSAKSIKIALQLLKLSSIFEETAVEITTQGRNVIPKLSYLLNVVHCINVQLDVISTLFNLSFFEECLDLISNEDVHSFLVDNLHDQDLKPHAVCLLYHLSSKHENRQKFFAAGISEFLTEVMKAAKKEEMTKALAGLLVNMTLHPLCAEYFVRNGAVDVLQRMISVRDESYLDFTVQVLLKVVRNVSVWSRSLQCKIAQALENQDLTCLQGYVEQPTRYIDVTQQTSLYWEQNFWCAHVSFLWSSIYDCENEDVVVELVGILNNLTVDDLPAGNQWHDLMEEYNLDMLKFLKRVLDSNDGSAAPCCDDLKLEVILWLGELCADKECSCWLVNVLDDINRIFTQSFVRSKDNDMSIGILYFYEQLLLHEETRFQVIGGDGVIDAILLCLEEGHALETAAARCLILIEDFNREHDGCLSEVGMYILEKRFELFAQTNNDDN